MGIGTAAIVNAIYAVAQAAFGRRGGKAPRITPGDLMPDFSSALRRPKPQTAKMARAALIAAFGGKIRKKDPSPPPSRG